MIVFDLDGTLALCDHRRHFVTSPDDDGDDENYDRYFSPDHDLSDRRKKIIFKHKVTGEIWKPDYQAFYEACDRDEPNHAVCQLFRDLNYLHECNIEIWSGRCESTREKTLVWIHKNITTSFYYEHLKMRPIGDSTPDEILKERWLDEAIASGKTIEMVFEDRTKCVDMWRRRGITCLQVAEGNF